MRKLHSLFLAISIPCLFLQSCNAQPDSPNRSNAINRIDREPAAAGKFYPASASELSNMLTTLFTAANRKDLAEPLALIVPHAGYVFSGEVAASAYEQLDRNKKYEHIFLIGSSHTMYFNGASVYTQGNFITPLGSIEVDELSKQLMKENSFINDNIEPHISEHSLEVQLPFLQYWLNEPFTIVPIILGGNSESNCRKLATVLAPYLTPENLFIISTDFSHYPAYDDAIRSDNEMADAILSNSTDKFAQARKICEGRGVDGLVTAMCGWTSVYTLLGITENNSEIHYEKISYSNSGDSPYGEKDRVVGYYALALFENTEGSVSGEFHLTDSDKIYLLHLARNTLTGYLSKEENTISEGDPVSNNVLVPAGAFVTLKIDGKLRGCIGNFSLNMPLNQTVKQMALAAATNDPRFPPVTAEELSRIEIEISVLTPLHKIDSIREFELGKQGIYIRLGNRTGTFLPQVAEETGWTKEEFLGHCSRDKAGIGWEGWKMAELYTYEAIVFCEHDFSKNH